MLGRRQIREKVVENLYAYQQNPIAYDVLERNMFSEIEKIYHLYVYQLNFFVALKDLALNQIEIGKQKFIKSEQDLNPNEKFVNNRILSLIELNSERINFTAKHKELEWDLHDELLVKTFQRIKGGKRYVDYMASEEDSFENDQKFIGKLFLRYIAENEDFHDRLEEKEMSWADDLHISNSMIQKTIGFFKESEPSTTLIKMLKDDEDKSFASKLLWESIKNWDAAEEKIKSRLENWDLERISLMDKIILVCGITELDFFKTIASRIIINEYVEIAKVYGSSKSNLFINGILDKYAKDTNRIN